MSLQVRKAVITAAGRGAGVYPAADTVQRGMQPVVDRDGVAKPVIQVIAEEALAGGVEEIGIVCADGDEEQYRRQFAALVANRRSCGASGAEEARATEEVVARLCFFVQPEPRGYGHAVFCARAFTEGEPFLLLLNDHLYRSIDAKQRCSQQIISLAAEEGCAVAGVRATRESLVGHYGTLAGRRVSGRTGAYQIEKILEKPSLSTAEVELQTAGLRAAHYLCFFGMHVLTPGVFSILEEQAEGAGPNWQLTPALDELARRERYLALEVKGHRYDIGQKYGLLQAQLALGMAGPDHDDILSTIVETLAEARLSPGKDAA